METNYFLGGQSCAVARGPSLTLWLRAVRVNRLLAESLPAGAYRPLSDAHAAAVEEASIAIALAAGITKADIRARPFIEVYPLSKALPKELVAASRYAVEEAAKRLRQYENHGELWQQVTLAQLSDGIAPGV